ncbi:MAG: hypothetical protein E7170_03320 [Firmicutes bacterium]|nr:hypothetical protein [Bacillota bacterium]
MKKILLITTLLFLFGCENLSNTPIKKTEELLKKYQTLDNDVISDLNYVVDNEVTFSETQKEEYIKIMKKHYQNMTYEIKDDETDGNKAEVEVEIEVTDFNKVLKEADLYLEENNEEFLDDFGNLSISKFNDYKIEQLKKAKEKIKYTIEVELEKIENKWRVKQLDKEAIDKLNGIYNN